MLRIFEPCSTGFITVSCAQYEEVGEHSGDNEMLLQNTRFLAQY